jgi:hypothetical protein
MAVLLMEASGMVVMRRTAAAYQKEDREKEWPPFCPPQELSLAVPPASLARAFSGR